MLYCQVTMVTFRVLEPYAVKVARTVLRRERRGNPPDLSGEHLDAEKKTTNHRKFCGVLFLIAEINLYIYRKYCGE